MGIDCSWGLRVKGLGKSGGMRNVIVGFDDCEVTEACFIALVCEFVLPDTNLYRDMNEFDGQGLACFLESSQETVFCIGESFLPQARVEIVQAAENFGLDLYLFTLGVGADLFKSPCESNHFHLRAGQDLRFD